jgi:hypothetical protein
LRFRSPGTPAGTGRELFGELASKRMRELNVEADEREDRTWVIVWLPSRPDFYPEPMLDDVSALISQVSSLEQSSQSGATQIKAAIRSWWARQRRSWTGLLPLTVG